MTETTRKEVSVKEKKKPYVLDQMMVESGMPVKFAYSISEVSRASGVASNTLSEDARLGRIQSFLPPGRVRGRLVKAEWFEEWWNEGVRNAG